MDGVLVDTDAPVTDFWIRLAAAHNVTLTATDFVTHMYGCTARHTLAELFPQVSKDQCQLVLADLASYEARLIYHPLPGALDLLAAQREHGVPMALVTGATRRKAAEVSRQLGLDGVFPDGVFCRWITAADFTRGKPDPACYVAAALALKTDPGECLVFEDAVNGGKGGGRGGRALHWNQHRNQHMGASAGPLGSRRRGRAFPTLPA